MVCLVAAVVVVVAPLKMVETAVDAAGCVSACADARCQLLDPWLHSTGLHDHTCGSQTNLHSALETLLNLEKTSRLAEDITATKLCCAAVLEVCFEAGSWELLQENIVLLSKRRSQLKQARVVAGKGGWGRAGGCKGRGGEGRNGTQCVCGRSKGEGGMGGGQGDGYCLQGVRSRLGWRSYEGCTKVKAEPG